jgi:predicted phosphodiesterase
MRILVAGDLHMSTTHTRWVVQRAVDLDIGHILQVGDFGFWTHERRGVRFLDQLGRLLTRTGRTMTVVRGNHDNVEPIHRLHGHDRDQAGFINVCPGLKLAPDGLVWTWGGRRFLALGGAYSPDKAYRLQWEEVTGPGTHWFPGEEMTTAEMEAAVRAAAPGVAVIVAHDRPASARLDKPPLSDPGLVTNPRNLANAIHELKPLVYVHGHMHYRYDDKILHGDGGWTRVVGISSDPGTSDSGNPEDSVYVLDTDDLL